MKHVKAPPVHSFEESIRILKEKAEHETVYLHTIFDVFGGRGYPLVIMCLSLPFCLPLQIPGFSTPFGLLIAFLGLRMLFGHRVLLPKRLLQKSISRKTLDKILDPSLKLVKKIKRFSRPRLIWLHDNIVMYIVNGFLTCVLGLLLALPLPIPLTNIISAWAILLIHFGLLEDDGVFILVGYLIAALCFGFFIGIFIAAMNFDGF
jgi:hypothetical protein